MFFLAFLFFVALIVWLVMNGLNEMRWVQAHSHDEEVAADPGILPSMAEITGAGEKIKEKTQAAFQEDGALGKVKEKTQAAFQKDGALGKVKEKTQAAFQEDGVLGKAKQKAQAAMQDDGALGKAKQKFKDGDYVTKAKALSKNAGEKIKDVSTRRKPDNTPG